MERDQFLRVSGDHQDSLAQLKAEKSCFSFDKKIKELWLGGGRELMEKVMSEPGTSRR